MEKDIWRYQDEYKNRMNTWTASQSTPRMLIYLIPFLTFDRCRIVPSTGDTVLCKRKSNRY
jgi:hypothetical protein